ncbi:MAG: glycosyltransferase [bacterium]|nr:glycosyltransferase [bacterium]
MNRPLVSILMPVYNGETFLESCLESIKRQTLKDYEVVIVDDGSDDASAVILDDWAREQKQVRVIHESHHGLVATLNLGLELCCAPFVARLDCDDLMHPQRLELQLAALEDNPSVGVVSCLVSCFPRRRVAGGFRLYEDWLNSLDSHDLMARERFVESPLAHPSAMYRRDIVMDEGGYRHGDWPEDYDLWLRLFEKGIEFSKIRKRLYFWREHSQRLTRVDERYAVAGFRECRAKYLIRGPLSGGREVIVWGAGRTGRRLTRLLDRFGAKVVAFVDIDPAKIGREVLRRPVFSSMEMADLASGRVVLAAVASRGARDLIRSHLRQLKLEEGSDFWCVA